MLKTRSHYSEIVRRGGPEAQQIKEEVQHCLVSALGPIRRAVKSRDVMSTFEALSAVAKAQGQVTKAIERHTADPRTMPMDDDVMALLSQGNMPVEKTEA